MHCNSALSAAADNTVRRPKRPRPCRRAFRAPQWSSFSPAAFWFAEAGGQPCATTLSSIPRSLRCRLQARPPHTHNPSILPLHACDDRRGRWIAGQSRHRGACLPSNEEQLLNVNSLRPRARELDEACADAVGLARAAAEEEAGPGQVGEHLGVEADADRICTHLFACLDPAYAGWRWAITLARASRSRLVTVSESLLLPGPEALLAPEWVPWRDRVRPGDLGVGDLLPAQQDDERLVPAGLLEGDEGVLVLGGVIGKLG